MTERSTPSLHLKTSSRFQCLEDLYSRFPQTAVFYWNLATNRPSVKMHTISKYGALP